MRPGGFQDASRANEHHSPVDTDPEDPVIGKKQLPMPAKRRLRRADAEKLRRVLAKLEKVLTKLSHGVELFNAQPPVYTSALYVSTFHDSIKMIGEDATVIKQFLTKNEDNGTSKQLCIRAQRTLANAQPNLNLIHVREDRIEHLKGMLAGALPICTNDDVQFFITLR